MLQNNTVFKCVYVVIYNETGLTDLFLRPNRFQSNIKSCLYATLAYMEKNAPQKRFVTLYIGGEEIHILVMKFF